MDEFISTLFPKISIVAGSVIGAGWAFICFNRNNLLKSAEILVNLEKDYSKQINFLLSIEN